MEKQKEINETVQELFKQMDEEVKNYKEEIDKIDEVSGLEEKEQELIKEMDANDEYIKGIKYPLQESVQFGGRVYKKDEVAKYIVNQFKKLEINWQMTLGYHLLTEFWKSNPSDIKYGELDTTLRTLQQLKFKGPDDWKSILVINEYFKFNHEDYTKDLAKSMLLAEKHNIILDRMKLISKKVDPNEVVQEEMFNDAMKQAEKNNQ